jgi:hypothetical protein
MFTPGGIMKKIVLMGLSITFLAFIFSCNKQKPHKLDYKEKIENGTYTADGLPGEGFVGAPDKALEHHGYHQEGKKKEEVKTEAKEEAKPEVKEEAKPEVKEEAKPEEETKK